MRPADRAPQAVRLQQAPEATGQIVQAARRLGVDANVLAWYGRSGLHRTLLGSMAEAVLHDARRPVYVVRAERL